MYFNLCKDAFLIKFLHWRNTKVRSIGKQAVSAEWEQEIPRIYYSLKSVQSDLFEDLDGFAEEQLINNKIVTHLESMEESMTVKIIRKIVSQAEQNIIKSNSKNDPEDLSDEEKP